MAFTGDHLFMTTSATLRRELRILLRSPRVYLAVAAFAGLIGLLCASSYPYTGTATSQIGVQYARSMVSIQLFGLWLAALTAIPALAIFGIHQDAKSGNLEQFACTPLRPRVLYGSKALALAALYLLGAAAVLPISGIAFFLAGVEVGPYLGQLATLCCFAMAMIALSLQIAARVPATLSALVRTVLVGLSLGGGIAILFFGYDPDPIAAYLIGFTAVVLMFPTVLQQLRPRTAKRTWFESAGAAVPTQHRPTLEVPDNTNPIAAKDRHFFTPDRQRRRRRIMIFVGIVAGILPTIGPAIFTFFSTAPLTMVFIASAASYLDFLLYGTGALLVAALFLQDGNRPSMDGIRSSLISEREFLNDKVRVAWHVSIPVLVGWGAASCLIIICFGAWTGLMGVGIGYFVFRIFYLGVVLLKFHFTLLLAAAGATFGRGASASITSALLLSAAGHIVLRTASSFVFRFASFTGASQNMVAIYSVYALTHLLLIGAALALALVFARWRFRRLWRGVGE